MFSRYVKGVAPQAPLTAMGAPITDPMAAPWGGVPNPGLFSQTRSQLD